jgi:hypothetical protein
VLRQLAAHLTDAIGQQTGAAAAAATLNGYRSFAQAHPQLYALLPIQPGNDPRLAPDARALMASITTALGFHDALGHEAMHALRLIRSAAEGFIRLEAAGGFGETTDIESSWKALVRAISVAATPRPRSVRAPGRAAGVGEQQRGNEHRRG